MNSTTVTILVGLGFFLLSQKSKTATTAGASGSTTTDTSLAAQLAKLLTGSSGSSGKSSGGSGGSSGSGSSSGGSSYVTPVNSSGALTAAQVYAASQADGVSVGDILTGEGASSGVVDISTGSVVSPTSTEDNSAYLPTVDSGTLPVFSNVYDPTQADTGSAGGDDSDFDDDDE